jgi:quercetin dioxygenase-like cupin family protein
MRLSPLLGLAALSGLLLAAPALAETQEQLLNSQPITTKPLPDPTHIPIVFGKDIKWEGESGEHQAKVFGDATKPGIYGILIKWDPGFNSKPHFHSTARYIYVVSGTWWVSTSTTYDNSPDKMYPIPAGSFVTDIKDTIHWDGAKASTGPCILFLVGEGPMVTTRYVPKDAGKAPEGQEFVPPPK